MSLPSSTFDSRRRGARAALSSVVLALTGVLAAGATAVDSLDRARQLHREGRFADALAAYAEVIAEPSADAADAAVAYNNSCVIRTASGDYRRAADDCREALALRERLGNERGTARTLNNLALALQSLGAYDEAAARFNQALEINHRREDVQAVVVNLANLGGLATLTGDYDAAIARHVEVARISAARSSEAWAAEQAAIARVNHGVVLEKLGAFEEALDLYQQVLGEGILDPGRTALVLVNAGVVYRNLGDPLAALDRFDRAAEIFRAESNPSGLSNALLNKGLALHVNLDRPGEAETAYREALEVAAATGDRPEEIQDLFYLGRLLLQTGRRAEAEEKFARSLALATASGSAEGRWSALEGLGRAALAAGELERSWTFVERAIGEIEAVRSAVESERLRAGYFGDKRPVYEVAVEVLAALERASPGEGHATHALEIVQQAKARDLLDAVGLEGRPAQPLSTAEIRDRLGNDLLIEFFVASGRLYRWVVDRGEARFADLGPAAPVLERVGRIHAALAAGGTVAEAELTRLSVALLADAVAGIDAYETLRVAPDGRLFYLPFELLAAADRPRAALVARIPVAYLPSGSSLPAERRGPRRAASALVAIGDPIAPETPTDRASRSLLLERFALPPLAAAERELERISGHLGGATEIERGARATEATLRAAAGRGTRVLHLATHTVVDELSDRGPAVLLSAADADDGLLFAEEIATLDLQGGLVVLASCSTSLGSLRDGRAVASLTGSFLAAGADAVVATLWDVGDAATAAFMEQFYFQLGRGLRPEEALLQAKERMRAAPEWSRPGLWGGYVLVGVGTPVASPRGRLLQWLALSFAGLVLVALWLGRRRGGGWRFKPGRS